MIPRNARDRVAVGIPITRAAAAVEIAELQGFGVNTIQAGSVVPMVHVGSCFFAKSSSRLPRERVDFLYPYVAKDHGRIVRVERQGDAGELPG
jgi:hypothetical protein